MTEFVPASRLYDVERRERVAWDWSKRQPIAQSQREIERSVADVEGD